MNLLQGTAAYSQAFDFRYKGQYKKKLRLKSGMTKSTVGIFLQLVR